MWINQYWTGLKCVSFKEKTNCTKLTKATRLCHPPDGSVSPKYKLLCFITIKKNCKEKNALALNRDRCCHLVLCLRLILFHYHNQHQSDHLVYFYNLSIFTIFSTSKIDFVLGEERFSPDMLFLVLSSAPPESCSLRSCDSPK